MSAGRSALGEVRHHHAVQRRVGRGRVPVQGDRVLELRAEQIVQRGDRAELAGVPDRHVAAVVLVPQPARLLLRGRDGGPGADLVRSEQAGVSQRDGLADVQHVGRLGRAVLRLDRVDLLLAGAVREGGVDLDAVLGGEGGQDGAVVRPRRRQRDDVERAFLLGRRDQRVHARRRPRRRSPWPSWLRCWSRADSRNPTTSSRPRAAPRRRRPRAPVDMRISPVPPEKLTYPEADDGCPKRPRAALPKRFADPPLPPAWPS